MADPETVNAVDELENERSESGYRFVRPPIQSMSGIRLRITTNESPQSSISGASPASDAGCRKCNAFVRSSALRKTCRCVSMEDSPISTGTVDRQRPQGGAPDPASSTKRRSMATLPRRPQLAS